MAVLDDPEQIAFYRSAGTPRKVPTSATMTRSDPRHDPLARKENATGVWDHHDATWASTNVLVVARPQTWWSAWLFWDADSLEFLSWYVNFELPWARTRFGFDSKDLSLDLVVTPGGEVIEKDRDDYDERIRTGLISAAEAHQVDLADAMARQAISAGEPRFNDHWVAWRPDSNWPAPTLPQDWAVL